jgi:hypothetical protein
MADDQWGHSKVHRVNLLVERIKRLIRKGPVTPTGLVGAMIDAATVDLRGEKLLPLALKVIGDDKRDAAAVKLLTEWVGAGAHRVDRKRTGHYDHQAAIALFDTWWDDNGTGKGGLAKGSDHRGTRWRSTATCPRHCDKCLDNMSSGRSPSITAARCALAGTAYVPPCTRQWNEH